MIGRRRRRSADPEWADEVPSGKRWLAVRNPDLAATRRQRKSQMFLLAVLTALPTGVTGCVMSVAALRAASNADIVAAAALAAVQHRERIESARHTVKAVAEVQQRLVASESVYADAVLVPDSFVLTDLDGEQHIIGVVSGGERVLTALVDVVGPSGGSAAVGVFFTPTSATPRGEDQQPLVGECEQPYGRDDEDEDRTAADADAERERALNMDVTYTAVFPDNSTSERIDPPKLEEFLTAWVAGDQPKLRELGNYTTSDSRGWFGIPGWRYMPGTARVVSAIRTPAAGQLRYLTHVQFVLCGGVDGGPIVQDMGVQGQRDGELTRILSGGPVGIGQAAPATAAP